MNKFYKLGFLIVAIILGYIIGNYIPLAILKPKIIEGQIDKGEYYRLLVSIISAVITFCAVLVALFKDDLRELWKRPIVQFNIPEQITIEDLNSSLESETINATPIASRYISRIEVKNIGNLPVINAEIYLDKLEFVPKDSTITQSIECSSSALLWNSEYVSSIIIPPGGKKLIQIAQVSPPEKFSTPDSATVNKPPTLAIGEIESTKENNKGTWVAKFSLYAQNHKPTSFEVEIQWNGLWKTRLTEFKNHYQISKKS